MSGAIGGVVIPDVGASVPGGPIDGPSVDEEVFFGTLRPDHIPLTPQMILAMVRRQLEDLDEQVVDTLRVVEGRRYEAQDVGEEIVALRELYDTLRGAGGDVRDGETIYVDRLDEPGRAGVDPVRSALGIETSNDDNAIETEFAAILNEHGITSYSEGTEFDLAVIKNKIDTLQEKQRQINSGNEMVMMQLQTLMQQRTQQLQAGSNLLASIDEASKTIVGNLR